VTRIDELGTSKRASVVVTGSVHSSPILVTLKKEAMRFSEMSVLTRVTRRHIPDEGILHRHRRENLKYYVTLTGCAL
jgi:hypothetical protein